MSSKKKRTKETGEVSGQLIVFETYDMPGPPPEPVKVTPRHDEWLNIIGELVNLGVDQWDEEYSNPSVVDGSGWSLTVRSNELNIQSSGMNAYPENFDPVREVIERAVATAPPPKRASYPRKPRRCPVCGAAPVASILYGMPSLSHELMEKEERGAVVFGGCIIEADGSQPHWKCSKCGEEFYKSVN